MPDHLTRGAQAPSETVEEKWQRKAQPPRSEPRLATDAMQVDLAAVVLSVRDEEPVVLVTPAPAPGPEGADWRLPAGRFCPTEHVSLENALRDVVAGGTGAELGYVEQLVTDYSSAAGHAGGAPKDPAVQRLSVSYLALRRADAQPLDGGSRWLECYQLLPWEDYRRGRPDILATHVLPGLERWAAASGQDESGDLDPEAGMSRAERIAIAFGTSGRTFDDQRVVDRLDLVLQAGLLPGAIGELVEAMQLRVVAAGLGRLRASVRSRPVVFELLAPEFTLFELQRTVEAVLGPTLHKQNFRRLVEGTGLVEATGDVRNNTGGRPAKTFRFRREVLLERPAPGVRVRPGRAA